VTKLRSAPALLSTAPSLLRSAPKLADPFYTSPEWRALKSARRRDPDYREAKARAKAGEWLILDHVIERRDGGAALDPANTQWLTQSEHNAKTARVKRGRVGIG
jgi:5-methylcytosine-specific restriction protein A